MLSCVDANRLIARRADGDRLDAPASAALDEHLAACAGCRDALAAQRAVADLLRARPADRVSPQFHARLSHRLDGEAGFFGLADWRAWTFRLAPAAAALALAGFLTAEQPSAAPLSLEEWAVSNTGSASTVSLLWDSQVSSDVVIQEMLGVDAAAGEARDGR
jgi:anti-sigma factor RsiW